MRLLLLAALAVSPFAIAEDAPEEIIVYGDPFLRWDDTRWLIETELALPYLITFQQEKNKNFRTAAFQLRAILHCTKEWRQGPHSFEVDCALEDFAMRATVFDDRTFSKEPFNAQPVLDEIDQKLTGAKLQIQVSDNGRVTNIDLEGLPKSNRRTNQIHETLRLVLGRLIIGFDMKLRKQRYMHSGQWVEYNPLLMTMPKPFEMATQGSSMLVHKLDVWKQHRIVQSLGKGVISYGQDESQNTFKAELNGVSIYDDDEGFMTERVWSLVARATAGSAMAFGAQPRPFWQSGRIRHLGENDKPDIGDTLQVVLPGNEAPPGYGHWIPFDGGPAPTPVTD